MAISTIPLPFRFKQGGLCLVYPTQVNAIVVAVKTLRSEYFPNQVDRFKTEQQILEQLSHPNIVKIQDKGTLVDDRPFYTMPWYPNTLRTCFDRLNEVVSGHSRIVNNDKLEVQSQVREALNLFSQVILGIEYTHSQQVIHRDLKPENILVSSDFKQAVVADFRVPYTPNPDKVKFGSEQSLSGSIPNRSYYAPEQAKNSTVPVSKATDIFALGVILDELLDIHSNISRDAKLTASPLSLSSMEKLKQLAAQMQEVNPEDRPLIAEVSAKLQMH